MTTLLLFVVSFTKTSSTPGTSALPVIVVVIAIVLATP